jgi:hypothetical protein
VAVFFEPFGNIASGRADGVYRVFAEFAIAIRRWTFQERNELVLQLHRQLSRGNLCEMLPTSHAWTELAMARPLMPRRPRHESAVPDTVYAWVVGSINE